MRLNLSGGCTMVRFLAACSLLFGVVWAGLLPSLDDDTTCATPEEEQLVVVGAGICRIEMD